MLSVPNDFGSLLEVLVQPCVKTLCPVASSGHWPYVLGLRSEFTIAPSWFAANRQTPCTSGFNVGVAGCRSQRHPSGINGLHGRRRTVRHAPDLFRAVSAWLSCAELLRGRCPESGSPTSTDHYFGAGVFDALQLCCCEAVRRRHRGRDIRLASRVTWTRDVPPPVASHAVPMAPRGPRRPQFHCTRKPASTGSEIPVTYLPDSLQRYTMASVTSELSIMSTPGKAFPTAAPTSGKAFQ